MSRLRNFTRGLASGYLVLIVNVFYTLASIRIALEYLPKPEFGVWAVSVQMAGYLMFIDLGMTSSLARMLIEHKDDRDGGGYGGMLKTGMMVFLVQGIMILVIGGGLSFLIPGWLDTEMELGRPLLHLLLGQVALVAIGFQTRVLGQVLYAHQRVDIQNMVVLFQFVVKFLVLWIGFEVGWGVYSLLAAQFVGWILSTLANLVICRHLGLLPKKGCWGQASKGRFSELFSYGTDLFLVSMGTHLVTASQVVIVSRTQGMEVAAVWAVATKAFSLACHMIWKVLGAATPLLSEMFVRGEKELLKDRFKQLFRMVSGLSALVGVTFGFCNKPFLELWTDGRVSWGQAHDWWLSGWLVLLTLQSLHAIWVINQKQVKALKYVLLLEGGGFVLGGLMIVGQMGTLPLIIWSFVCTSAFSLSYCHWRFWKEFNPGFSGFFGYWLGGVFAVLLGMLPVGFVVQWLTDSLPSFYQFLCLLVGLGVFGVGVFFRVVLPEEWAVKFLSQIPVVARPLLGRLCGLRKQS